MFEVSEAYIAVVAKQASGSTLKMAVIDVECSFAPRLGCFADSAPSVLRIEEFLKLSKGHFVVLLSAIFLRSLWIVFAPFRSLLCDVAFVFLTPRFIARLAARLAIHGVPVHRIARFVELRERFAGFARGARFEATGEVESFAGHGSHYNRTFTPPSTNWRL